MPTSEDIRQSLLEADPEFRRLAEEHFRCEVQLERIHDEPYVNSEDLIQESVLKKLQAAPERSDGNDGRAPSPAIRRSATSLSSSSPFSSVVQCRCLFLSGAGRTACFPNPHLREKPRMVKDAYRFAAPPLVLGVLCLGFGW